MNHEIVFATDAATLAIFDPETLAERIDHEVDWWAMEFHQLPEVAAGRAALVGLGGDGVYRVRIADSRLTPAERAYAKEKVTLGVEVVSGGLLVGAGELMPGGGDSTTFEDYPGFFVPAENGRYNLEVYSIHWSNSADFQAAPGEAAPQGAPPDLVVLMKPRRGRFAAPPEEPKLFYDFSGGWLFPDEPRRVGPAPGMVLSTVVVARGRERLLKPDSQWGYRPVLAT